MENLNPDTVIKPTYFNRFMDWLMHCFKKGSLQEVCGFSKKDIRTLYSIVKAVDAPNPMKSNTGRSR